MPPAAAGTLARLVNGDAGSASGPLSEPCLLRRLGDCEIVAVPSIHCRLEFALEVRRAFDLHRPDAVAIEMAPALEPVIRRGIAALPSPTVVSYPEADGDRSYFCVDPCDSMVEAGRLAVEHGLPLHLVDLDVDNYRTKSGRMPDPYVVAHIGLRAYYERYAAARPDRRGGRGSKDYDRERFMTCRLRELAARHRRVLFVFGMAHWEGIDGFLSTGCKDPPVKIATRDPMPANPSAGSMMHVLGELPWTTLLYELHRPGPDGRVRFADAESAGLVAGAAVDYGPEFALLAETFGDRLPPVPVASEPADGGPSPTPRATEAASPAGSAAPDGRVDDGGRTPSNPTSAGGHEEGITAPPGTTTKVDGGGDVPDEEAPPFEALPGPLLLPDGRGPDKAAALRRLMLRSDQFAEREYGRRGSPGELRTLLAYVRNRAVTAGGVLPNLYHLVTAGKGTLGEDYAGELFRLATTYPFAPRDPSLPTVDIRRRTARIGGMTVRVRRRYDEDEGDQTEIKVKGRPDRQQAGGWKRDWKSDPWSRFGQCSHVPEDRLLEDFATYVRRRAMERMLATIHRTQEFTSSLLDGVDVRETVRRRAWDGRLQVRDQPRTKGEIGPVVVIFEEDDDLRDYGWQVTWLSEFDYESDLAFYATDPGDRMVGPGIARCEYGGFASIWPAQHVDNVWSHPDNASAAGKSEVLLLAAIRHAKDPYIAYVADRPPRAMMRSLAARRGRTILHLPLTALAPSAVEKIRQVHVLQGKHVRAYADQFIR